MPSIADVYDGGVGGVTSRRRLLSGGSLLVVGTVLAGIGILTGVINPGSYTARLYTGVFLGLAAPAVLTGVAIVLPARPVVRIAAAVGASVTLLGVAAFWYAYPEHWAGFGQNLTGLVATIYGLGILILAYCLFAGLATLKQRNTPGGTISLTRFSRADSQSPSQSTGLGGADPRSGGASQAAPTSDGGVVESEITRPQPNPNTECERCRSVGGETGQYCSYHNRPFEDVDTCPHWTSTNR